MGRSVFFFFGLALWGLLFPVLTHGQVKCSQLTPLEKKVSSVYFSEPVNIEKIENIKDLVEDHPVLFSPRHAEIFLDSLTAMRGEYPHYAKQLTNADTFIYGLGKTAERARQELAPVIARDMWNRFLLDFSNNSPIVEPRRSLHAYKIDKAEFVNISQKIWEIELDSKRKQDILLLLQEHIPQAHWVGRVTYPGKTLARYWNSFIFRLLTEGSSVHRTNIVVSTSLVFFFSSLPFVVSGKPIVDPVFILVGAFATPLAYLYIHARSFDFINNMSRSWRKSKLKWWLALKKRRASRFFSRQNLPEEDLMASLREATAEIVKSVDLAELKAQKYEGEILNLHQLQKVGLNEIMALARVSEWRDQLLLDASESQGPKGVKLLDLENMLQVSTFLDQRLREIQEYIATQSPNLPHEQVEAQIKTIRQAHVVNQTLNASLEFMHTTFQQKKTEAVQKIRPEATKEEEAAYEME